MREVVHMLALLLPAIDPANASHVGDRIFAGEEFAVGEPFVHHAIEPIHFVNIAGNGIGNCLAGIVLEMMHLPAHRPDAADLPEQPLVNLDAAALVGGIELAGLATKILQDGAGLEDRDRPPTRSIRIDDRRHAVVR